MSQLLVIDAADPLSLATILPEPLATTVKELPIALITQDEETLTTLVAPSAQQKRLKIQFWDEYELAIKQERVMSLPAILFGVCTKEYFLEFTKANRNVAWLISPRPAYRLRVAELIDKGLDQVEKIFEIPITPKNTLSVRRLQMEALKMLDMRKHGGYTQRIEQKTLQRNINSSTPTNDPNQENLGEGSIEELQMQVDNLQKRIEIGQNQNGSLLNTGPAVSDDTQPIDVTPRTVS